MVSMDAKFFNSLFVVLVSMALFASLGHAFSLIPGGSYPTSCPVIVQAPSGAHYRVYTTGASFAGIEGDTNFQGYAAFQMNGKPANNYLVKIGSETKTFTYDPSSSCNRCFIDGKPWTNGQVNPGNANQYCDTDDAWDWTTRELHHLTITPSSSTVASGNSVSFQVRGYDASNHLVYYPVTLSVSGGVGTLSNSSGSSGTLSTTFTGTHAGLGSLVASSQGITQSAVITVTSGALFRIEISPSSASLNAGQSQSFTARGYDAHNNVVSISPTWTLTGVGSKSGSGSTVSYTSTQSGSATLSAKQGSITDSVSITVNPGAISTVTLNPASASVPAGGTRSFTASAKDSYGNTVSVSSFSWSVTNSIGSVNAVGLFTAGATARDGTVRACTGSRCGSADVSVTAGSLHHIHVSPQAPTLQSGQTQLFSAEGRDLYNNVISITPTWNVQGGIGSITSSGLFSAQSPGNGKVTASFANVTGESNVAVVVGGVSSVEISPSALTLHAGDDAQFTAVAYDASGNAVSGASFSWESTAGYINPSGHLSGLESVGSLTVTVHSGAASDTASVNVISGALDRIVISPDGAVIPINESRAFTAEGRDRFNNPVYVNPAWSVDGGIGSVSPSVGSSTTFTATHVGVGVLVAAYNNLSNSVSITVSSGAISSVSIEPANPEVQAGEEQQFSATAYDDSGNVIPGAVFTWNASCGTIDSSTGLYTAPTQVGTCTVTASTENSSYTTTVTVTPGDAYRLDLSPQNASLSVGESQIFSAAVYDEYGNAISADVSWSSSGNIGSVSPDSGSSTTFTASHAGIGNVTAFYQGLSSSAVVSVYAGVLASIEVYPAAQPEGYAVPYSVAAGSTHIFSARGFDASGEPVEGVLFTFTVDSSVGSITSEGVFTAGSNVGLGSVYASAENVSGALEISVISSNLSYISISPSSVQLAVGESVVLNATGFDEYGNEVSFSPIWSVTDSLGAFDPADSPATTFNASAVGSGVISVRDFPTGIDSNVTLVVTQGAPASIVITPSNVTTTVNSTIHFTAQVFDSGNSSIPNSIVNWSSSIGAVDENGFFTAPVAPGNGTITATSGAVSSSVEVFVVAGSLALIVIDPSPVSVQAGGNVELNARGFDDLGNELTIDPTWNLTGPVGNLSDSSGQSVTLYASNLVAQGLVFIEYSGLRAEASVNVVPASAASLVLLVQSTTFPGAVVPLTALVQDQYGNPVGGQVVSFDLYGEFDSSNLTGESGVGLQVTQTTASDGLATVFLSTSASNEFLYLINATLGPLFNQTQVQTLFNVGSIVGFVSDDTGSPVPNVRVSIPSTVFEAFSATDGYYVLSGLPAGTFTVTAEKLGYGSNASAVEVALGAETLQNFSLARYGGINGTVRDNNTEPIEGANVSAFSNVSAEFVYSDLTNILGNYFLPLLPGLYDVFAEASGYANEALYGVEVFSALNTTVDFTLQYNDSIAPQLVFVEPTPANGSSIYSDSFSVVVEASDLNLESISVYVNSGGYNTSVICPGAEGVANCSASDIDPNLFADGPLEVYATARDTFGNTAVTETRVYENHVLYAFFEPTPSEGNVSGEQVFNVSVAGASNIGALNITVSHPDALPVQIVYCENASSCIFAWNTSSFPDSVYNLTVSRESPAYYSGEQSHSLVFTSDNSIGAAQLDYLYTFPASLDLVVGETAEIVSIAHFDSGLELQIITSTWVLTNNAMGNLTQDYAAALVVFSAVAPGITQAIATYDGFANSTEITVHQQNVTTGDLHGLVHDLNGTGIPNANVSVDGMAGLWNITDASGNYIIYGIPAGIYSVTAYAAEFEPSTAINVLVQADGVTELEFTLTPYASISGYVVESDGFTPISGVTVQVGSYSAITGEDGSYSIAGIVPDYYNVSFAKNGYATRSLENLAVNPGESLSLSVSLYRYGMLFVRVFNALDGVGIDHAVVTVSSGGSPVIAALSAEDGSHEFLIPPGTYDVTVDTTTSSTDYGIRTVYGQNVYAGLSTNVQVPFLP